MSNQIQNYRNVVDQPWGRMFYDLIYNQLNLPNEKRLKILDFGAGFCLTADHYAEHHDVTAAEPNKEMVSLRVRSNNYTLIPKGTEFLSAVADNTYDVVICHNVLEYVDDIDYILIQLERVLKPCGILSPRHVPFLCLPDASPRLSSPASYLARLPYDRYCHH